MQIETRLAETFPLPVNFFNSSTWMSLIMVPKDPETEKDTGVSLLLIPLLPSGRGGKR